MSSYEPRTVWCLNCNDWTETKFVDDGEGITEAWGAVSNDVDIIEITACCEGDNFQICEPEEDE